MDGEHIRALVQTEQAMAIGPKGHAVRAATKNLGSEDLSAWACHRCGCHWVGDGFAKLVRVGVEFNRD